MLNAVYPQDLGYHLRRRGLAVGTGDHDYFKALRELRKNIAVYLLRELARQARPGAADTSAREYRRLGGKNGDAFFYIHCVKFTLIFLFSPRRRG
jgi:hypothetical protein